MDIGVKTPKETDVPQMIADEIKTLKEMMKSNRCLSEEIASIDVKTSNPLEGSYRTACVDYGKALSGVHNLLQVTKALRTESRQDLLDGELAQRLRTNSAINFDYSAPLSYLLKLAANYEKLIVTYAEELQNLERLIFGQQRPISSEDIALNLKRIDDTFRHVTARVYDLDRRVQDLKDSFKDYRRSVYGDAAKYFPSRAPTASTSLSRIERFEGPSPFSSSSNSALLIIANALSRGQGGTGLALNIGLPVQQQSFGQQPFAGFGLQQQPQPFSTTTQSLFRPFGTAAAAPTVTTAVTPFASGSLSFGNALGTTTTGTATSTASSPWRFSSPFNTSSSGTLFGGTATNVGAVKPLGLATPLQQGAPPTATSSLQLLNPPLGSKRGKS